MRHSDFLIGGTFWCGGRLWRCTDVGTRTILAIRIDNIEIQTSSSDPGEAPTLRTLSGSEAEAEGLFKGPPYIIGESVFDEYDVPGCSLGPEGEGAAGAPESTEKQWEQSIKGPFMESRKVIRAWREIKRAAKEADLRAKARPEVLMAVVKCGAGHLMRAKDYDIHRSSCGRESVLPVTEQDVLDLELQEGGERAQA